MEFASGVFYLGCCFNVHVNYGLNQYVISFMAMCVLVYIVATFHDSLSKWTVGCFHWTSFNAAMPIHVDFFYAYTHIHTHTLVVVI